MTIPNARDRVNGAPSDGAGEPWPLPIPLASQSVPPFPVEGLPGWLREYVEALAMETQTPPDLAGLLSLAALATAAARKVCIELKDGWTEPLNIFLTVISPPATRKSAVFGAVTGPLATFEREEVMRVRPEHEDALVKSDLAQKRLARAIKEATSAKPEERAEAEAEVQRLTKERGDIRVPPLPRLIADDCTPEKLSSLLAEQGGRMAVLSPEGGPFEMMAGRYSERGPNFEVYLKGHAGDDLRVDRVVRPSEYVHRPALTLGLTIQPDVLRSLRDQPGFRGRGLLGRILYSLPRNTVGSRDVDPPSVPPLVAARYERRLLDLLGLKPAPDCGGAPIEHVLRLSVEARAALLDFMKELEPQLGPGGELEHISDWAGKLAGAVGRIAGLLHLADHASPLEKRVQCATLSSAIRFGRYFLAHALAAFAEMGADPAIEGARQILGWLARAGRDRFSRRDAHVALRSRFPKAADLDAPLEVLVDHSYIRRDPSPTATGGRPASPTFKVNPATKATQDTKGGASVSFVASVRRQAGASEVRPNPGVEAPTGKPAGQESRGAVPMVPMVPVVCTDSRPGTDPWPGDAEPPSDEPTEEVPV